MMKLLHYFSGEINSVEQRFLRCLCYQLAVCSLSTRQPWETHPLLLIQVLQIDKCPWKCPWPGYVCSVMGIPLPELCVWSKRSMCCLPVILLHYWVTRQKCYKISTFTSSCSISAAVHQVSNVPRAVIFKSVGMHFSLHFPIIPQHFFKSY